MNLIDRIKTFLHLQRAVNDKPKSKFRFGRGAGLFRRKQKLELNPELAYKPEHPFKAVAKCRPNLTPDGHGYTRLMKRMRSGKMKPKQYKMATEKINSAGIDLGY